MTLPKGFDPPPPLPEKNWTVKQVLWLCCFIVPPVVVLPIIIYKHYTGGLQPAYSLENIILGIIAGGWVVFLYVIGSIHRDRDAEN